jgi:hypothetical protein
MANGRRGGAASGFWLIQREREKHDSKIIHGLVEISADVLIPFCVSVNCFILILDN